ncbi:hypothetical protein D1007_10644 [Hordeum vulgare]|nr:hypothetical protein D1007_10644 [Hordeum vulgare]
MSESSGEIKSMLEALIKRVETGQLTADKHVEAQLAFNEQLAGGLTHLRELVNLTWADIDDVCSHRDQSKSMTPPSPHHQPQAATAPPPEQSFVRLANAGLPLIGMRLTAPLFGAAEQRIQQEAYQEEHRDAYTVKPPKHDFPKFDGSAPYLWIDQCETYFQLYHVPPHSWVTMATLYIEGHAVHWAQAFRQAHRTLNWPEFCTAVKEEFGPYEFELEMHKLLQVRQTDTVADYRIAFEGHMWETMGKSSLTMWSMPRSCWANLLQQHRIKKVACSRRT